jgi:hypothetical protein
MFQYRQVLVRMRQGDSDRDIKRARLMGRPKAAELRALALERGWLDPASPLPEDSEIAQALGTARRARSTISSLEPHRAVVECWAAQGVSGVAIHAALAREHGYRGSYSAVRRMLQAIRAALPPDATVPLAYAPAEAAQVDFGAGPVLFDPAEGRPRRIREDHCRRTAVRQSVRGRVGLRFHGRRTSQSGSRHCSEQEALRNPSRRR